LDEISCEIHEGAGQDSQPDQGAGHEASEDHEGGDPEGRPRHPPEPGGRRRAMSAVPPAYDLSVFINCPFDDAYIPLFRAAVFTVFDCGFIPRCALEVYNSGQVRIDKIFRIIDECRFGLHDISRTELDTASGLPRFNMPLELGIFLGAQRFGGGRHKRKNCLVLDLDRYRYQKFISDIAGQDIAAHRGEVAPLIRTIRDWLRSASGQTQMPGGTVLAKRFEAFQLVLPDLCRRVPLEISELTFSDYANIAAEWLRQNELLSQS
jgi:hypothetical protein